MGPTFQAILIAAIFAAGFAVVGGALLAVSRYLAGIDERVNSPHQGSSRESTKKA